MAQKVCRFLKFGYCKYEEKCRKLHIHENCEKVSCKIVSCELRHPKVCRYLRDFGYCKFGEWCKFSHKNLQNNLQAELNTKAENINKSIVEKSVIMDDIGAK